MFSEDMVTRLAMMGPPPNIPPTPPPQQGMFGGALQPQAPMAPMKPMAGMQQSRQGYQMNPPTSIGAALVGG